MKSALKLSVVVAIAVTAIISACGGSSSGSSGKLQVVAVENFWGSIASQIGGDRVEVTAIISNPDTDPHDYEPNAKDGRSIAGARYVIVNGAGYDSWADKLISANPSSSRKVLNVGDMAGRKDGDNPHMWYSPPLVLEVVDQITADLKALDQADAAYFDQQSAAFKTTGLKQYNDLRAQIKQQYGGTPVGSTESIFDDLAMDLGLNDITPPSYEQAIAEGTDVSPQDQTTMEQQITNEQIKVLVFNSQNATPDIQKLVDKAKSLSIPVVEITETLAPENAKFQDWQSAQLDALQKALAAATGH